MSNPMMAMISPIWLDDAPELMCSAAWLTMSVATILSLLLVMVSARLERSLVVGVRSVCIIFINCWLSVEKSPVEANEHFASAHRIVWRYEGIVVACQQKHVVVCDINVSFLHLDGKGKVDEWEILKRTKTSRNRCKAEMWSTFMTFSSAA